MASRLKAVRKKPKAKRKGPKVLPKGFVDAQWKPGQSGNPKGYVKRRSLEDLLLEYLDEHVEEIDRTRLEAMVQVIFSEGVTRRNPRVLIAIMDRLWPKPLKIQGDPDLPLIPPRPSEVDLSALNTADLKALKKLRDKIRSGKSE